MKKFEGKTAVLYSRVSTTDQKDNGYSLPQQKEILSKFCSNYNIKILEYFEEDYTGTTLKRPAYTRLKAFVSKNKVDLILVHKWDRFTRSTPNGLIEIEAMQNNGIEINAIAEPIDFSIPQQKIMLHMYIGLGEVENDIRSQRTKNGIIGALKEGRYVNRAPIGYLNGKDPNNSSKPLLKPCPVKSKLIEQIFQDYSTGLYSQEYLRKKYYYKGIKRSKSQFSNLLSNLIYNGKILIPEHNGEPKQIVKAIHQPLIDDITFLKVQQVKYKKTNVRINTKKNSRHEGLFPLRGGVLKCLKCGANLTGSRSKSRNGSYHTYYHCNSRKGCKERFSAKKAHDELVKILTSLKPREEVLHLFKAILVDEFKSSQSDRIINLKRLEREKKSLEKKLDNLTLKYAVENVIDKKIYLRLKDNFQNQIDDLTIEVSQHKNFQKDIDKFIGFGLQFLVSIDVYYKKASTEVKRRIIGSIFSGKLVFENKKYRTAKLNDAVALIFNYSKELSSNEHKKRHAISNVSYSVAGTGLEPVTFGL